MASSEGVMMVIPFSPTLKNLDGSTGFRELTAAAMVLESNENEEAKQKQEVDMIDHAADISARERPALVLTVLH
ncbi:hypothetical protein CLCR_03780 [Cladophialophora carrionii]|uniref:Uncharacterized protein n=1 Tax=Cladophialophora carrionii TaxID=86049 RepID=A0A1C1CGY1_9EURO|nr:hypothetical protein CLCR_03780 [Cladophialophora carrionii]